MENIDLDFFFDHKSFYTKKGQSEVLKNSLDIETQKKILSGKDLYRSNCGILLTRDQEFNLFRKYNYLKYRISEIQKWKSCKSRKEKASKKRFDDLLDIREIIIKCNTRLLINPARKFSKCDDLESLECSEFISNGYLHLLKAIEKFDYRKGFKFSTYFCNVLFRNLSRDVSIKINKSRNQYELNSSAESALLMEDSFCEQRDIYNKRFFNRLLNQLEIEDSKSNRKSRSMVLKRNYGLCGEKKQTLREIGEELGVSKERVRQIRMQAEDFVRQNINLFEFYDPTF